MEVNRCDKLKVICYICGLYTPKNNQRLINEVIEEKYKEKFNREIIKDTYVPEVICTTCNNMMSQSTAKEGKQHGTAIPLTPMLWEKPNAAHTDCYACLVPNLLGKKTSDRLKIEYPEYPRTSSRRPVWRSNNQTDEQHRTRSRSPHSPTRLQQAHSSFMPSPLPTRLQREQEEAHSSPLVSSQSSHNSSPIVSSQSSGEQWKPNTSDGTPQLWDQATLNDYCRELHLTKDSFEFLGSGLKNSNFLKPNVRTTVMRDINVLWGSKFSYTKIVLVYKQVRPDTDPDIISEEYDEDYENRDEITKEYDLAHINDLEGLFDLFKVEHKSEDWRLFLDGSSSSLKAVLLHNDNTLPSVPLAYCRKLPEKYESIEKILELINYNRYKWEVIVDFKLINIISGLMGAASKYPCVHCLWDAKYKGPDKYTKTDWPKRHRNINERNNNAIRQPLVDSSKILMPPLHIKIGLVTQLFKKIYANNKRAREVLKRIFPQLTEAKMKAGVYNGPQIRDIFANENELARTLSKDENEAFKSLKAVCEGFLGNKRASNYQELIKKMMCCYQKLDINITIKMHSLICHLDLFKSSCGKFSDEQGERFHQDIKRNEDIYKGHSMVNGLGTYCWSLVRETDPAIYKRKASYDKKTNFFLYLRNKLINLTN